MKRGSALVTMRAAPALGRQADVEAAGARAAMNEKPGALAMVGSQLLKDFATLNVNDAKPDRFGRPLGLACHPDRRSCVPCSNFDIVERSELPEVANAKFMRSMCHSRCATPR